MEKKFAIRVLRGNFHVGYLGAAHPGEQELPGVNGGLSCWHVRPLAGIHDSSFIPFWKKRQQCHGALAQIGDVFFAEYGYVIEELY